MKKKAQQRIKEQILHNMEKYNRTKLKEGILKRTQERGVSLISHRNSGKFMMNCHIVGALVLLVAAYMFFNLPSLDENLPDYFVMVFKSLSVFLIIAAAFNCYMIYQTFQNLKLIVEIIEEKNLDNG